LNFQLKELKWKKSIRQMGDNVKRHEAIAVLKEVMNECSDFVNMDFVS
jgi:hypothetical protein